MDIIATAAAIAARYAPGVLSTPTGCDAIRSSSASLPNRIAATPAVLVFLDGLETKIGAGAARIIDAHWLVRLYYDETGAGDLERDTGDLEAWLTVLLDAHKVSMQLGGTLSIAWTRTVGAKLGTMRYAGVEYNGVELRVDTATAEGWTPTA